MYLSENGLPSGKTIIYAVIAAILFIAGATLWPIRSVPTGSRGVITVGGAIRGIEGEGFTLLAPWQRLTLFNIRAEAATVENAEGSTSDTQPVRVSMTVRYSIAPNKVAEVYEKYSHDGDLASYVTTATQEVVKAVSARYTAPELISQRAKVSSDISTALGVKLALYGAQVINVDMRNFSFNQEYMTAINAKVNQEQLRLGAENKLKTVEAEQKQKVAVAEAEAAAVMKTSDGDAYATVTKAKAAASALDIQGQALVKNPSVIELKKVEVLLVQAARWDGKLPQHIYAGAPIPFLNLSK